MRIFYFTWKGQGKKQIRIFGSRMIWRHLEEGDIWINWWEGEQRKNRGRILRRENIWKVQRKWRKIFGKKVWSIWSENENRKRKGGKLSRRKFFGSRIYEGKKANIWLEKIEGGGEQKRWIGISSVIKVYYLSFFQCIFHAIACVATSIFWSIYLEFTCL